MLVLVAGASRLAEVAGAERVCVRGGEEGTRYWFSARDLTLSLSHMARKSC